MKAFHKQKIPEFIFARKETADIDDRTMTEQSWNLSQKGVDLPQEKRHLLKNIYQSNTYRKDLKVHCHI